jgi:ABC-type branched-subunit amino acid transport system substrate-binding protein
MLDAVRRAVVGITVVMVCAGCGPLLELDSFRLADPALDAAVPQSLCKRDDECVGEGAVCSVQHGRCVALLSNQCRDVAGAVDDATAFRLGALLTLHGAQASANVERMRSAQLAVEQINAAGGVTSATTGAVHRLVLVTCDTAQDPVVAGRHLIEDLGVTAIIGPSTSQDVLQLATRLSIPAHTLTISPTAMASSLANLVDQDLSWQMVPTDEQRAPLMAQQLDALAAALASHRNRPVKLSLIHRNDAFGHDMALSLRSLQLNGHALTGPENLGPNVRMTAYDPEASEQDQLVREVLEFEPDIVIVAGAAESVANIMAPLEAALHGRPEGRALSLPYYLLTDASKVSELLRLAERTPDLVARVRGVGLALNLRGTFQAFERSYRERYGQGNPRIAGLGTTYDAVYALAYALAASGGSGAGPGLARGLRVLDQGEHTVQSGPADLPRALRALSDQEKISAQGLFTPFSWDEQGVPAQALLEVWCLGGAASELDFVGSGLQLELASGAWRGANASCGVRQGTLEGLSPRTSEAPTPPSSHQSDREPQRTLSDADAGVEEPDRPELFAEYKADNTDPHDGVIGASLRVRNRGTGHGVPLSTLKLRYYLTAEMSPLCLRGCATELFWAGVLPAGKVISASVAFVPSGWVSGYLETSFASDAGVLRPGEYAELHLQFHMTDYSALEETNDYSFDAAQQSFGESQRIAVLRDGELVWGDPPLWETLAAEQ